MNQNVLSQKGAGGLLPCARQKIIFLKLTVLCMLLTGLSMANTSLYGQGPRFTFTVRNARLTAVFKEIKKGSSFRILYNDELIKSAKPVTFSVKDAGIEEVMNQCLSGQPFSWKIMEETIIVTPKALANTPTVHGAYIDTSVNAVSHMDVHGKIINEKGEAVAGASVTVKETGNATPTDSRGEFSLTGVATNATLIVSSVTYETQEIKLKGNSELTLQLAPKVSSLGEVEVTVNTGYQSIPKERATGSFSQPDKEMFNARVSTDILSKLDGITSGLVFNKISVQTGNSGIQNASISIRGRSTVLADPNPLVIVDNFPYDGDITNINPNDIENVTILKDAAASSIWGATAGNGVIVITTKKGRYNQPIKTTINSNITISQKPDVFYDRNFINSNDFINVERFLFSNNYYANDLSNTLTMPPVSPVVELLQNAKMGRISQEEADIYIESLRKIDVRNDIRKYYYRKTINQQYNINFSGGNAKSTYSLSVGYDKNLTSLVGNDLSRITINSLNVLSPLQNVEITGGVNYANTNTTLNSTLSDLKTGGNGKSIYPYANLTDNHGNATSIVRDYRKGFVDTSGLRLQNWQYFPLEELKNANNTIKAFDLRLFSSIKYKVSSNLNFEIKYQFEKGNSNNRNLYTANTYFSRNLINQYSNNSPNPISTGLNNGILSLYNTNYYSHNGRVQINYNKTWQENEIAILGGLDIRQLTSEINNNTYYGYNETNGTYINIDYGKIYNTYPSGSSTIYNNNSINGGGVIRNRSYFLTGSYTLKNKYIFSGSSRVDQANLYGVKANQKSIPLWSAGIKWDISKELFLNNDIFSLLALRVTYGLTGNTLKNGTAYPTGSFTASTSSIQPLYLRLNSPGNPELTWEKIKMINIGIDFSLLRNIISGNIEYYLKRGKNLLGQDVLPSSSGFSSLVRNYATISGKGFDINLSTTNLNRHLKWISSFIISYSKDKVINYTGINKGAGAILPGKPVQSIFAYKWAGLNSSTGNPRGYLNDTISENYSALINQTISQQVFIGPATPILFGGIRNTFSYKQIELSFNISFKTGYYFLRKSINYNSLYSLWQGNVDYQSRWQKKGDEVSTNVPSMIFPITNSARESYYNNSEILAEKGDHIRFQDLYISYDLGKKNLQKLHLNRLQIYVYLNNIGILWKSNKQGIDPDYLNGIPTPKSVSFGIKGTL